ncbi:MAG: hypothetical protein WCO00_10965 [Rhodospirillaceae bacterium]
MIAARSVTAVALATALFALSAAPASAQAPRMPPVFDQLASPFTEGEIGGIGCALASVGVGAGMVGLMGGPAALGLSLQGALSPRLVLEASAAVAFVFSSACYIGQAMAPVVLLGWTSLLDSVSAPRNAPTPFPAPSNGNLSWLPGGGQQGNGTAAPLP